MAVILPIKQSWRKHAKPSSFLWKTLYLNEIFMSEI